MDTDLTSLLMAGIGICMVLAGIIVGSLVLSSQYPAMGVSSSPTVLMVLVLLAVLIVVFAAVVVIKGLDTGEDLGRS
jgi:TRAP-type C4-dicarboxylate transport system permease small subunit